MLNRVFEEQCRLVEFRTALVFGDEHYTYGQLGDQVARYAAILKRLEAAGNLGVALVLRNCPLFIFCYLAASRLGVPTFLLDTGSKPVELLRIFSESKIAIAICEPNQQLVLEQIRDQTNQSFVILVRGSTSRVQSIVWSNHQRRTSSTAKLR